MARLLFIAVALVTLFPSRPAWAEGWTWIPGDDTRPTLWADGREPYARAIVRSGESRVEAVLADRVGWLRYESEAFVVQAGLAAGAFLSFEPTGELTFALLTFDGLVTVPITVSHGAYTHTVEWSHTSAHFADGIRGVLDYDAVDTGTYSREALRWISAVAIGPWTPYGGARVLGHSIPPVPPLAVQAGLLWDATASVPLFAAADLQAAAEYDWRPRVRAQFGFRHGDGRGRSVHVGLEGAAGPDEKGKWFGREDRYVGVFLALDPEVRP